MFSDYLSMGGTAICGLVGIKLAASVVDSLKRYSDERSRARARSQALRAELNRHARYAASNVELNSWQGWRKFRLESKVEEVPGCHSLTFVPHDGKPVPSFRPGQFVTFSLRLPGETKPVVRCYSLSDSPQNKYRCTIKKVAPAADGLPPGRVSAYFNDGIKLGDIVDVKAPAGKFFLDMSNDDPVVLIAGGVGITPMISMINAVIETNSRRMVYMFCGFRNRKDHLFYDHLRRSVDQNPHLHLHVSYSRPTVADVKGKDYDSHGYVDLEVLRAHLPSNNFQFYLCGPATFMESVESALKSWGVPDHDIKSEAFGPASKSSSRGNQSNSARPQTKYVVDFARSGKKVEWNGDSPTLLELAEEHGIAIDSGCRAGNCSTCAVAVKAGRVKHTETPDSPVNEGSCLTCLAVPESDIQLDA